MKNPYNGEPHPFFHMFKDVTFLVAIVSAAMWAGSMDMAIANNEKADTKALQSIEKDFDEIKDEQRRQNDYFTKEIGEIKTTVTTDSTKLQYIHDVLFDQYGTREVRHGERPDS